MKASVWKVAAIILANVAVICLAHPDGGNSGKRHKAEVSGDHLASYDARRNGIDNLMMRYSGGSSLPNEARGRDMDAGKPSNTGGHATEEAVGRHNEEASSGDSRSSSADDRGSGATAMINFNLGGPLQKSGRYMNVNAVWVGGKHNGRGFKDVNAVSVGGKHDDRGSVIVQSNNEGYDNQEQEGGIPEDLNRYSEMSMGDGHSGGGGGGLGSVNTVGGNEEFGYTEPESEHNGGGFDGSLGDHNEGIHSVRSAGEYNNQVNIGRIVGGNNGYDEVSTSGFVGGGDGSFGDKFIGGSGGAGFGGDNVDGVRGFGYSDSESEQNSLDYNEGVHSADDGGGDSNGGEYNIARVNGAPALVGGGVGGVYLTKPSNEGAYGASGFRGDEASGGGYRKHTEIGGDTSSVGYRNPEVDGSKASGFYTPPGFGGDEMPGAGYGTQAESGGDISSGGYSESEVDGSKGSGLYTAPVFGGDKVPDGDYSRQGESEGEMSVGGYSEPEVDGGNEAGFYTPPVFAGRSPIGSIIRAGILQAEYKASDNSGGYGGTRGKGGSGY